MILGDRFGLGTCGGDCMIASHDQGTELGDEHLKARIVQLAHLTSG